MEPPPPTQTRPPPAQSAPAPSPRLPILALPAQSGSERWTFQTPTKQINSGPDVAHFLTSQAYRDIGLFVLQLNYALCPRRKPGAANSGAATQYTLSSPREDPPSVRRLQMLLERIGNMVDEAPPDPGPRRFGNVSFRTWHRLMEERVDGLLRDAVAPEVLSFGRGATPPQTDEDGREDRDGEEERELGAVDELRAYFLGAFGSCQRLDYGTGHELSFLAFLGCLWKLGAFMDGEEGNRGDIERSIVLGVIEPYLAVARKLILTYTLEPAGSHGVWGLDDHFFIPYIFGSAQLTRAISDGEPMPQEGSVLRAPKPADITKPAMVEVQRGLNMYFSAVGFINDVKRGPFWEHSPILFDVSGIKDGWGKINKGMIKMFNAEVLSKFPVVQHFPFGSFFSWDRDPDAPAPAQSVHMANQPMAAAAAASAMAQQPPPPQQPPYPGAGVGTAAPWAQATRMPGPPGPGIPYSRVQAPPMGAARTPPPDPVHRQGSARDLPGPSLATGAGLAPGERPGEEEGSTSKQISLTKAPWA